MGAGAVGCYFGGMLARGGTRVTLIARPARAEAIEREGLFIEAAHFQGKVAVAASPDVGAVRAADLVLLCVKTVDTESAARSLRPHLGPGALLISLQNGVDNVERIRRTSGIEAVPAVVYVAAEMVGAACVKHSGRGDLILGPGQKQQAADLTAVAAMFEHSGVPCRISEQIELEQWRKLILNCAYNAISALGQARYGNIARHPLARQMMMEAIREAVAVARAAGILLDNADMEAAGAKLGETMAQATSSTAQDIARRKPTEIDSLNGYVARRGRELGVSAPVNQTLQALVKLLEESTVLGSRRGEGS